MPDKQAIRAAARAARDAFAAGGGATLPVPARYRGLLADRARDRHLPPPFVSSEAETPWPDARGRVSTSLDTNGSYVTPDTKNLIVAGYIPFGSEADPAPLLHAARAAGCAIALPHVASRSAALRFLAWDGLAPLAKGTYGLLQPDADAPELVPDIILAPLVAFDRALNRLGQGAGFYDAAFSRLPDARRIGVAYGVQQVEVVPTDPWDMPLHAIITERGWITP